MKNQSKRTFIKSGLLGVFSLTGMLSVFTSNLTAKERPVMSFNPLIDALKSADNAVCENVAIRLSSLKNDQYSYDLHLRSADLNSDEVKRIAEAIKAVHDQGGPALHSFSLSYNPNLRDDGVLNLVKNLPSTLTEIGLVGCNIGDGGADALLLFAQTTPKLYWLCVENNAFSSETKKQFIKLGQERNGLLVVV